MKKSIIVASLLASLSTAAFAETTAIDTIADTVTWTGTVPAIVATGDSAYISSLTGSLDDAALTFERATDGTLSMLPTVVESFEVRKISDDSKVTGYTVTLNTVAATVGTEALPAGSFDVKHNGTALAAGTASAVASKSDFLLEITEAGLERLQAKEEVEVKVVANVTVTTPAI